MKYLKTYEGLFSFLKKNDEKKDDLNDSAPLSDEISYDNIDSENDLIEVYISRLKKIKHTNPYVIEKSESTRQTSELTQPYPVYIYSVNFDDTPIEVYKAYSNVGHFSTETERALDNDGFVMYDAANFLKARIMCDGEWIDSKADGKCLNELFDLCAKAFKLKNVYRIKKSLNSSADLL